MPGPPVLRCGEWEYPAFPAASTAPPVRDPGSCGPSGHRVMDITPVIGPSTDLSMDT